MPAYRLDIFRDHTAAPETLHLPDTTEDKADAVAAAIQATNPAVWVDVWELHPQGNALTGWFRSKTAN